jgi:hypothetical protein
MTARDSGLFTQRLRSERSLVRSQPGASAKLRLQLQPRTIVNIAVRELDFAPPPMRAVIVAR